MADDQRDQPAGDEPGERQEGAGGGGQLPAEGRRDQLQEQIREIHEGIEEEREEEMGRARVFTKDQIVHEAAIVTRQLYGSPRYSLDMETYGERDESEGYYDLLDCWAIAAHVLDRQFHTEFLKRATAVSWGSRLNRYLIPNYYVFSKKGID